MILFFNVNMYTLCVIPFALHYNVDFDAHEHTYRELVDIFGHHLAD